MNHLTKDRMKHCKAVGVFMQKWAPKFNLDPGDAALLGYLHDFGYFAGTNETHAQFGGQLLKNNGYKYWREVAAHGTLQGLSTPMGILLNIADMSIGPDGKKLGFDVRLMDISGRYGYDSKQFKMAYQVVDALKKSREYNLMLNYSVKR